MSNSKRIFLVFAVLFFVVMIYIGYDISSRTTFPGSKPQLKERIKDKLELKDSTKVDSAKSVKVN
ncbi:MAG: hypothetical protein RLO12_10610 [Fulvivirga sp.]